MEETLRPLDILNSAKGKRVLVELKNGKQLVGVLLAFDIHINIVLDDAEEIFENETKRKLGKVFVRGDTIIAVSVE
ncbi:MAG TPA: small nuclear ribonucleoprotein [Candidatus Aenigmarchaeota archaeon]|nr:small nuclear ribonucleoprotein [Candidatus Aenigmarchaeota archaeon]